MECRARRSITLGAIVAVTSVTLAPTAPSAAVAGTAATVRVTGTLLVSPAETAGGPAYALALADGDLVPVRGDLGPSPEPGAVVTADLELPPGMAADRGSLDRVDASGSTLIVRDVVRQRPPPAETSTPAVHEVYVAAPANLGTFSMSDSELLGLVSQAGDYWEDESDGRITAMPAPATIVRYTATVATDANDCGLSADFFEVVEEAAAVFPSADFVGGTDHLVLLAPSLCDSSSAAGRAVLGDSLADGGTQVTRPSGPGSVGTLAHEWGHNFGLMHSNLFECDDFECVGEYDNLYNVMGRGIPGYARLTALSTAFRSVLGVHAPGEVHAFTFGDGSQPVTITRRVVPRGGETGLRGVSVLDPDTGDELFIELRSGTLQDTGSAYAARYQHGALLFEPGVVIEHVDDRATVLDRSGSSASLVGRSWTNRSGTLSVTAGPFAAGGMDVTVAYAPGAGWPGPLTASVSGEPVVNRWLSATTNAGLQHYQWLLDGAPIVGAEDDQLRVGPAHVGHELAVRVTEYAYGKGVRSVTSAPVTVRPGALGYYDEPWVSGTAEVGRTLTTSGAIWESPDFDGPTSTALQWRRDGAPIAGATGSSYVVQHADAGHRITVSDTGSRDGYASLTLTSPPTALVPLPQLSDVPTPTVQGTPQVDATLVADAGTWPTGTVLSYQWRADGDPIAGAEGTTYVPAAADVGRRISVRVTGAKDGYQPATRTSAATSPVALATMVAGDPTITGRARVGRTLRAVTGTWTEGASFRYRWKANGVNIRGATSSTLLLRARQRGKRITVVVTGSRAGYTTAARTSPPTRRVRR